jgi:hypothetical protein
MVLLFHPFVSMLRPRAHELERVNGEQSQGNNVRVKWRGTSEPSNIPKIYLYNYMEIKNHMAFLPRI